MENEKIRFLGRHLKKQGREFFAFSGAGFEFVLLPRARSFSFALCLDSELREHDSQYIGIYLNGEFHAKKKLVSGKNLIEIPLNIACEQLHVKVIKLNEVYLSSLSLEDILLKDAELGELPPRRKLIGFFGDSITCGYGLLDYHGESFSMESEDFGKTYAFLAAEELGMDCCIVARSGISLTLLIYCDTPFPQIYDTVDMFEKCPLGQPLDYAVINLGTNDHGCYCAMKEEEKGQALEKFSQEYFRLLERIVQDNKGVKLVLASNLIEIQECFLNAMEEAGKRIERKYGNPCRFVKFSPNSDGADNHPYMDAHKEAGALLVQTIASGFSD